MGCLKSGQGNIVHRLIACESIVEVMIISYFAVADMLAQGYGILVFKRLIAIVSCGLRSAPAFLRRVWLGIGRGNNRHKKTPDNRVIRGFEDGS